MLTCSVAVWLLTTSPKSPEELQRDLPSAVDETGQVIEADGGAPQGREVEGGPHTKSSKEQDGYEGAQDGGPKTPAGARAGPVKASGTPLSRRKTT